MLGIFGMNHKTNKKKEATFTAPNGTSVRFIAKTYSHSTLPVWSNSFLINLFHKRLLSTSNAEYKMHLTAFNKVRDISKLSTYFQSGFVLKIVTSYYYFLSEN